MQCIVTGREFVDPGGWRVLTPENVGTGSEYVSTSLKCHSFHSKLCEKWKVKLIFRGVYRLSGTGIVECLKIVYVGCDLKQFDGLP